MSTSAKSALVGTDGKTLCPAVKAFDSGTVAIKPMFIERWIYIDGVPFIETFRIEEEEYRIEEYKGE